MAANPRVRYAWGIYDGDGVLQFVELDKDPMQAWSIYLGWPTEEEIADKQRLGYRCIKVAVAAL